MVVARALKTPARHTGCGKKEQPVRRSPMRNAARTRRARLPVPVRLPAGPRKTAPAPRQRLTQAGCRVSPSADGLPWCRASGFASREARLLPVFHRLPTGSFSSSQSHGPQGRPPETVLRTGSRDTPSSRPKDSGVRVRRGRSPMLSTHPPPTGAPQHSECVVFSRRARPENKLRMLPPIGGQMPPRQPG